MNQNRIAGALPSDFLSQEVWNRARECVLLTSTPLMLTPPVQGPNFEDLNPGSHWNHLGIPTATEPRVSSLETLL